MEADRARLARQELVAGGAVVESTLRSTGDVDADWNRLYANRLFRVKGSGARLRVMAAAPGRRMLLTRTPADR